MQDTDEFWDIVMQDTPASTPRTAVRSRDRSGWGSVCVVFGALLSVGAGAYFLAMGILERLP